MSTDKKSEKGIESSKQKQKNRPIRKEYIAAILIIVSFLIFSSTIYSLMKSDDDTVQTLTFVLRSPDTSWFIGEGHIWFEDGNSEILEPWPSTPFYEDGTQVGWQAIMPVDRTFTEPVTCNFEYGCSAMNITVGPFSFLTNDFHTLYLDEFGRTILVMVGSMNTV